MRGVVRDITSSVWSTQTSGSYPAIHDNSVTEVGTDAIVAIIFLKQPKESRKMPAGGCVWGIFDGSVEVAMR